MFRDQAERCSDFRPPQKPAIPLIAPCPCCPPSYRSKARLRLEPESALSHFVAPIPEGNPPQHAFKLIEAAAQPKAATQPGGAAAGQAAGQPDLPPAASASNKNLFERFSAKLAYLQYRC